MARLLAGRNHNFIFPEFKFHIVLFCVQIITWKAAGHTPKKKTANVTVSIIDYFFSSSR